MKEEPNSGVEFSAIEDDGPNHGKFTLRLLPTPIHHNSDPASDHLDRAIFEFATGTNPDLLLVIESTQAPGTSSERYNKLTTDAQGVVIYPTLIPGATYRICAGEGAWVTKKQFVVEAGRTLELGEITVNP